MNAILRNPYNYSGAVIARLAVCIASALWSLIVIANSDALMPTSYGSLLFGPEDMYGWFFLVLSVWLTTRVFRTSAPPRWPVAAGYFVLMLAWGFVWFSLILTSPIRPTATAWVTVGAGLAVYAFIANRRPEGDHVPGVQ